MFRKKCIKKANRISQAARAASLAFTLQMVFNLEAQVCLCTRGDISWLQSVLYAAELVTAEKVHIAYDSPGVCRQGERGGIKQIKLTSDMFCGQFK